MRLSLAGLYICPGYSFTFANISSMSEIKVIAEKGDLTYRDNMTTRHVTYEK